MHLNNVCYLKNIIKTFLNFFCVIYKMEKQRNIKREIKAIRKLLNNNRDSLSRDEINEIQFSLYKKQKNYDF